MSLLAGSLAFTTATLLSRILGLARDMSLAAVYGAGAALDAYMISIIFPFFLRKIFGEGAMGSSFVPFYKTADDRDTFTSSVVNTFLVVTLLIVAVVEIFPDLVPAVFSMGYPVREREKIETLVRITSVFIPEVFLWAVFYSVLNSHGKYFLPALTPLFINVGVIAGTLAGRDPVWSAVGFVIGGGVAAAVLGAAASKYWRYRFTFRGIGKFMPAFLKATGAMVANQFNLLVDTNVASFLGMGAISSLQLASRLYQLPLGLFGVAVSTVALSVMSGEKEKAERMKDAITTALFLTFPAAVGLFVLSKEMVFLIFGFGRFQQSAVNLTSEILRMYSIGVVPYSLFYIALRYHHSSKRMGIPLLATFLVSGSNAVLDILLAMWMGAAGIALATSISGILGLLFFTFRGEITASKAESVKVAISSAVMGTVLLAFRNSFRGRLMSAAAVLIGVGIYFACLWILRSEKLKELKVIIYRRR